MTYTFYIAPDPDETDPLLKAHNEEAERQGAEFWNYGKYTGEGDIMSKTDKGYLSTLMRDGKVKHYWLTPNQEAGR
jgi:hypothetical protein